MLHQPIFIVAIVNQHDETSDKLLEPTNRSKDIDNRKVRPPNLSFLVATRKFQMILEVRHEKSPLRCIITDNVLDRPLTGGFHEILDGRNLFFFPIFRKPSDICVQVELFYV
jgi:hypothetical protein